MVLLFSGSLNCMLLLWCEWIMEAEYILLCQTMQKMILGLWTWLRCSSTWTYLRNHCFGEESSALQPPLPSQHSCLIHSWICKSSRSISFCLQHEHKACGHITCARSNCSTTSYQSYWSSVCWAGYRAAVCTSSHGTPQVGKDWRHREWLSALS